MKRDANGLVTSVTASKDGKTDRTIRREYDEFDRVTKVDYGNGETETFAYDKWGRLSSHTRGKLKETYAYDHFGRLAQKDENGLVYTYAYDAYGNRTSRTVRSPAGETTEERRSYDKYGRLVEISSFGTSVKYRYDAKGRIARQTVDGSPIDFAYTKYGQLAGKYLGGKENPDASVEYEYSKSGRIVARTANGVRQTYEYDGRGQLLAVKDADGNDVEHYAYDKAGNMLKKSLLRPAALAEFRDGRACRPATAADYATTTFAFDGANQLVSSTTDGVTTKYAYDAAGRLVKEGNKTYCYGYLDKVLSVTEGERKYTYDYHVDGQLARADCGNGKAEDFGWDGLALIKRGDERFVNEPHIGGGNPVASSKGMTYFNDMLGTTVGAKHGRKYTPAALTAFGETIENGGVRSTPTPSTYTSFFTGKPEVEGLGHAFLMRNYHAGLAKWQSADPMGYPDGWNQLAYCRNATMTFVDFLGAFMIGCFDLNSGETSSLVLSADDMVTGNQLCGDGNTQDSYGEFFCGIKSVTRGTGGVLIKLVLAINVIAPRHDAQFRPGEKSKFHAHKSEPNDSYVKNPVYEAVEAHERGHAEAFFEQWRILFSAALTRYNIDDPSLSISAVEQLVSKAYTETWNAHIAYSGYLANERTNGWFEGKPTWERMPNETARNGDILYVWKKKE